jgi:hypothetical protein
MVLNQTTFINGSKLITNTANNSSLYLGNGVTTVSDLTIVSKFCDSWGQQYLILAFLHLGTWFAYNGLLHYLKYRKRHNITSNEEAWEFLRKHLANLTDFFGMFIAVMVLAVWAWKHLYG